MKTTFKAGDVVAVNPLYEVDKYLHYEICLIKKILPNGGKKVQTIYGIKHFKFDTSLTKIGEL